MTDSSEFRYAIASSTGRPGVIVVEFDETMTTAGSVPFANAGRNPFTTARVP